MLLFPPMLAFKLVFEKTADFLGTLLGMTFLPLNPQTFRKVFEICEGNCSVYRIICGYSDLSVSRIASTCWGVASSNSL